MTDRKAEPINAEQDPLDTNVPTESIPSASTTTKPDEQLDTTKDDAQSTEETNENRMEIDIDQQQQVPSSSTESIDQCSDKQFPEPEINHELPTNGMIPLTTTSTNEPSESVSTNANETNNDDDCSVNGLASSSDLVEVESDCRTETKLSNKLDKSEIINELTTASIANCDSSEILDDSMNVNHSNGSNNVSDSRDDARGDNVDTVIENDVSCNLNGIENGAKNVIEQSIDNRTVDEPTENGETSVDSSSRKNSTDATPQNDEKLREEPTSSMEVEPIDMDSDNTPSVHSNISDKGGGTDTQSSTLPLQNQQSEPANKIVLNNSVDSINSSVDDPSVHHKSEPVAEPEEKKLDEPPKIDSCSTSQVEEKIVSDRKHSNIVENQIPFASSVIRPTNLIAPTVQENVNPSDEYKSSNRNTVERIVRSESLPHIELPKPSMDNKPIELKQKSYNASPNNSTLDLTVGQSLPSRQSSLYVSNPDFSRSKPSTEDLSSLRMKPPDFSKVTQSYSTNNLKIPNPNFNEIEPPKHQSHFQQHPPSVNPANFAEISKRLNYISDLQLKTTTTPSTHTNSFDRSLGNSRSLSNLYVKTPDFSEHKKKYHDSVDEPTAHVIHKNPYPMQSDKSNKSVASTVLPPSDPSIIYRSYPQISQDVTMSIVPTHNAQFPQQQQQHQSHHQPLSQKQNVVEPHPSSLDRRFKQSYPSDVHKGMYRSPVPTAPHHLYENRIPDPQSQSSQTKPMNISYKHKTEPVANVHPYQRESSRTAVIQSAQQINEPEAYTSKVQSTYVQRSEIQPGGYYEKPVAKPVTSNQQFDYMQHFNNARYSAELNNDRVQLNKSNYERVGYCEPMPGMYQPPPPSSSQSLKHNSSASSTQMAAPSNRPLRSPISKPIDIPSAGHMNPPQYWPSHSPRITQSPISLSSSPLSGRVTQSPAGASPSPQHHIIHTPNAMPAQSPTPYHYASPHQQQTSSSPYHVPTTAPSPMPQKDSGYQKPSKSKSTKLSASTKGVNVPQPSAPNYYYLQPEANHYPGHQYSMKVEQSAHYPPHQYSTKTEPSNLRDDARTKPTKNNKMFPDYVDLTKPSRPSDIPSPHMPQDNRYDHRHLNERHEMHQETVSNKHASESSSNKHVYNSQQKTIMDPYVYRKASEEDLNYEIIKKTLNKDISIRRSDADLSCSIFDNPKSNQSKNVPHPSSNEQYYGRGPAAYPPNFNYPAQPTDVRRDSKGVPFMDGNRYYGGPAKNHHETEQTSRPKTYPVENSSRTPNDLKKHDLSVTVSRISAAIAQPVERGRLQHSETTIPITHQPSTSRHHSTTVQAAKSHVPQPQPNVPQKPSSTSVKSVLTPVKRESPLDLSVKTVKTKADSTGDDYAVPSSSRDYNAPLSLKVDFSPNFQKHTRMPEKSSANNNASHYESQRTNLQYPIPAGHRPATLQHPPMSQNVSQRSTSEKMVDPRYQPSHHNPHPNQHQNQNSNPHGSTTYTPPQAPTVRSHQTMPTDPFKHQPKPLVLSPTVPTVFGRKPEELKNLPINPEMQDYKANVMGPHETDHRSKNQTIKATNYHNKAPEHLPSSYHKSQEIPARYSDFKTKNFQNPSTAVPIESSKERPPYPYPTGERSVYVAPSYTEQRPMHVPNQSRLVVEQPPQGHFDSYHSRKRSAEPPSSNDQYPKVKQIRHDEPIQHAHYYNSDGKRYPPVVDPKVHERYDMPAADKLNYQPKFAGANYQREMAEQKYPSVDRLPQSMNVEPRENINSASVVRENIPPNYVKQPSNKQQQHPYHYREQVTYNHTENKAPTHPPNLSYQSEQHQKHLAYQKSKKEAYKQLPSPPTHNYYQRDAKHHPYENYNPELYKPDTRPYYPNDPNCPPNQQYHKKDPPSQQIYQQPWPHHNQPTLPPDSSKQPYYPTADMRGYREFIPNTTHPTQHPSSSEVAARSNHRFNPVDSRHQTTIAATTPTTAATPTLKGADQTVISKLRTNLEMKEIEKQKMLRNQSSTETVDDDTHKSDIASLIAARIRTKGELKGFTPMPATVPEPKIDARCDEENNKREVPVVEPIRDLGSDMENASAFDLLDWGSACNDFVEQLQGSGNKKRGRRRRGKSSLIDTEFETVEQEVPLQNLPGVDYKCDIDENALVNIVKAENVSQQEEESVVNHSTKKDETSSSDEDKPLLFLRQKSLNELGKLKASHDEDASTLSESTKQSNEKRSNVLAKLTEKIAKNKKGQQREKRENEKRISIASSSESEDETSPKMNKRPKKAVRKPRTRSSVGYKNTSDDETSENGSKNSKRKNDHTKRKKSSKSSSDSEPLKQRKKTPKVDSDEKSESDDEEETVEVVTIKQEVISDDNDCKQESMRTPTKKEPGVINVKMEETMTRSKRKQELERQKANSKILRNDKMVKNVTTVERKSCEPKKTNEKNSPKSNCKSTGCKDEAKKKSTDDTETGETSKNDSAKKKGFRVASVQSISSDSEDNDVQVSPRRRTRSAKSTDQRTPEKAKNVVEKVVEKKWSRNSPQKKAPKEPANTKPPIEQFPPGWENEVYEFKRSLKIPASLITIKRPSWYRKSISLPDLDPHSSDTSETFSEKKQLFVKPLSELSDRKPSKKESKQSRPPNSTSATVKNVVETPEKRSDDPASKSIIDLLHQKIIHPISRNSKKSRLLHSNEPKLLPQSNEVELLPTPGADNVFKHQSVFETAVLKSRTRKEYRVQKNQEIIREVFGCDDRPASAPPLQQAVDNKVTFDQKYKQYLEKMNMDFGDSKLAKCEITPDVSIVKQEKIDEDSLMNDDETQDTEINDCERNALDIKEEPIDSNERDTPSVSEREGITPSSFSLIRKRGRGARGGRRKGSSGNVSMGSKLFESLVTKKFSFSLHRFRLHSQKEEATTTTNRRWTETTSGSY